VAFRRYSLSSKPGQTDRQTDGVQCVMWASLWGGLCNNNSHLYHYFVSVNTTDVLVLNDVILLLRFNWTWCAKFQHYYSQQFSSFVTKLASW